ncbi:MAG: NADH-quinone oxidoreductase subunit C [Acidimicrobiia bacterium]|nr:NADH-quinone oxidoreductase subunit C [Acidimicrobiia bacterium]MDH3396320.1 NADH-quinone oxidoreductase subunit C [Acidimicrobiia bacterium]MDH5616176.1 NADH-quinone oxidoreductase subunit C [Acidimicrobiia bacterium]
MPSNPSDTADLQGTLFAYAEHVADVLDAEPVVVRHGTIKAHVPRDSWIDALTKARDDLGLIFFSWLSAIDWSNKVEVGDPPTEEVDERFEILCTVGDLSEGKRITLSTEVSKDEPTMPSATGVYRGANWHERETFEMFGIDFVGHPDLKKLYLVDGFEGNPLRKSFPLLSREVKPWPGTVDVEAMPSTENPEA